MEFKGLLADDMWKYISDWVPFPPIQRGFVWEVTISRICKGLYPTMPEVQNEPTHHGILVYLKIMPKKKKKIC